MKEIKRNNNIDLIRCLAIFSVIAVHFFLNIGYYGMPIIGKRMYFMMLIRTTFMICIPLFLLMTGYLMKKKTLSKKYYKSIIKILITYFLASIACIFFRKYYLHNTINIFDAIFSILEFNACEYAWYVEMYIGLFMLIPFLNILWDNLKDKRALIITLLILTALPSVLNIYDFRDLGIVINNTTGIQRIVPQWWINLYPITYYFIGAYISENKINISTKKNFLLLISSILLFGTYNFIRNYGKIYDNIIYAGWASVQNLVMGTLAFLLILNLDLTKLSKKKWWKIILKISELSFGAYLISYIPDHIIYPKLLDIVSSPQMLLEWYPIVVILIFIISLLLSWVLNIIVKYILKFIDRPNKKSIYP